MGAQTAINLAAGVVRMRFPRYFAAVFLGGLAWAGLWGVVISGVVGTWLALFLDSPWTALGVIVVAAVLVIAMMLYTRGNRARQGTDKTRGDNDPHEPDTHEHQQTPGPVRTRQ